jgi:pseudouridine-5'-phosphate glycosidase
VLGRVAELTGGESRRANIALLVNNARVASEIAVALAALE